MPLCLLVLCCCPAGVGLALGFFESEELEEELEEEKVEKREKDFDL